MRRVLLLLALVGSLTGCDKVKPPPLPDGGIVLPPVLTRPPALNVALLPVAQGAQRLLIESGPARLEIDPTAKDALTALGECADLVSYCYEPGKHSLAECLASAPTCATSTPWGESACCPAACKEAFTAKVSGGTAPLDALESVLFLEPDCFPGVRQALEAP